MTIPQPTAFYRFEGNGNDSSGNGYHLESTLQAFTTGLNGQGGTSVITNNDYGESLNIWNGDFTLAMFVKINNGTDFGSLIWSLGSPVKYCQISLMEGGRVAYVSEYEINGSEYFVSIGPQLSGWHHLAIVQDGTSLKIYLDAVLKTTESRTPPAVQRSPTNSLHAEASSGAVDNLYIFTGTALDASQIAELYNGGAGYEYSPPVQRSPDEFYYLMF